VVVGGLALAGGLIMAGASCETPAPPEQPDPENIDDVIRSAAATDEALVALLAATPKNDPTQAAVLDHPVPGGVLPGSPAAEFAWHVTQSTGARAPAPAGERGSGREPAWAAALERLGFVGVAHAHGAPMNGRGYLLVVSNAAGAPLLRVFTDKLAYTPGDAVWGSMVKAGTLRAVVINAVFENNRIAEGGGPFQGVPSDFTVE